MGSECSMGMESQYSRRESSMGKCCMHQKLSVYPKIVLMINVYIHFTPVKIFGDGEAGQRVGLKWTPVLESSQAALTSRGCL